MKDWELWELSDSYSGQRDYTKERDRWIGDATVKDLIEEIRKKRK